MVTRTPGAFPYFKDEHKGVTGDSIRADADDPALHAKTMSALSAELDDDAQKIPAQMSGDITAVVQKNPATLAKSTASLAAKAWYAVGLVRQFAECVDLFDTSVNTINVKYNSQVAEKKAANPPDIKAGLKPEYTDAVTLLEEGASMVATSFEKPDDDTVRNLIASGMIPLSASVLWPGITLTTNQITNAILSGDYPANVKKLMLLAAESEMDAETAMRYYLELNRLSADDLAKLLPENFLESGLVQPDGTTCGSSSLVVAKMLTHPDYAMKVLLGYDPDSGDRYPAPPDQIDPATWRFEQESLDMHDKTNSGLWIFHWPKAWGTYPGDLTDEMNDGAGAPGSTYHWLSVGHSTGFEADPDRVYETMVTDVNNGDPVPIYVGNEWAPRHVVLATGTNEDGDLTVYDPAKGHTMTVTRDQWKQENSDSDLGGGWDKRWIAVLPEQDGPQTVP